MNPHELDVELFKFAQECAAKGNKMDPGKVWQKYRSNKEVMALFGDSIIDPKTGDTSSQAFRNMLDAECKKAMDAVETGKRAPFIHRAVELKYQTLEFVSSIINAIEQLKLADPREVRLGTSLYQQLHKDTQEQLLGVALEFLEKHGAKTEAMADAFAMLFPTKTEEQQAEEAE